MNTTQRKELWLQFGAAIDMFERAVRHCSQQYWDDDSKFWYVAYHTLFFLDYYLDENPDSFRPPEPFSLSEFDEEGALPERTYTKDELLRYLEHCRAKCRALISGLDDVNEQKRFINAYRNYSRFEILLYNMRHVQHHTAQLNLFLRMKMNEAPDWVSRTKAGLEG